MDEDWQEFDPNNEDWVAQQVSLVLDGALRQLRQQMPPCEVADVMRRFGPRILDHIELEVGAVPHGWPTPCERPRPRPTMRPDIETPVVLASRRVAQPQVVSQQRQPVPASRRKSPWAGEPVEVQADDAPGSAPASAALALSPADVAAMVPSSADLAALVPEPGFFEPVDLEGWFR